MQIIGPTREWVLRLLGRQRSTLPPFDFSRNRYKARTRWPPEILKLSERRQFYFERRWKRRMLMKSIRPRWQKGVKIFTWVTIGFVTVYAVFFYDHRNDSWNPQPGEQPFQELRDWTRDFLYGIFGSFWTDTAKALEEARESGPQRPALESREAFEKSKAQRGVDRGTTQK
jgi:hypothetical protein